MSIGGAGREGVRDARDVVKKCAGSRRLMEAWKVKPGDVAELLHRYEWLLESDEYLGRFVKARDGDASAAAKMFVEHLVWRREYKVDGILAEPELQEMELEGEMEWRSDLSDVAGVPTLLWRVRRHDPAARAPAVATRFFVYMLEKCFRTMDKGSARESGPSSQMTLLADLHGVSMRENADTAMLKHAAPIIQSNYPERQHRTLAVPVSAAVYYGWKLAQKFLDRGTASKVVFLRESESHTVRSMFPAVGQNLADSSPLATLLA
uniref:CRAL-TRIO domain-containing protein n=1 Tax=Erythrolobus australicus TaxID=1077150 RepID=A0A7S1TKK1_9RHOD|mmetsp:Transcript_2731/g.7473  ORF Transcript_2731/g.7473 Transcript_2731/m.7473 type:complete len:264 (+) Transcript_2731:183-974(+)|eukprot:CAMPEP_0185832408 /NCGR_PEP_ID=MMETSP1353-20130828/2063_1 /TAXON_ID=1077150 /ORGANISM="Erythrolobus australicus, Strain CCMP3124" /LENGTH=263 /DNA_ID=CAMNT_0028530577 /DNA_START=179 /DNA_END=970 /DNA_ORIENTATION=+